MGDTICIDKKVFSDVIEELQIMMESLELMSDPEFMESYRKAKDEIKRGDVVSFDDL